ncbi:MAG: hypothetical protein VX378_09380 [Pseudomonadota bacterium]|nr:hypothetical protein [Pseudomonadota bacterium]
MTKTSRKMAERNRVWGIAVMLGEWTRQDLAADAKRSREYIAEAVADWEKDGFVRKTGSKKGNKLIFKVVREDIPPMYGPDGRPLHSPDATPEDLMWRTMRKMRSFSPRDVQMYANTTQVEVTVEQARKYCQFLAAAQYLRVDRKAVPSKGIEATYALVMNTGIYAPKERRVRAVYDENLHRVTHTFEWGMA